MLATLFFLLFSSQAWTRPAGEGERGGRREMGDKRGGQRGNGARGGGLRAILLRWQASIRVLLAVVLVLVVAGPWLLGTAFVFASAAPGRRGVDWIYALMVPAPSTVVAPVSGGAGSTHHRRS